MKKQNGFTLVEIAIVLVIIGLLLGGILKGQELINSAKVKNLANDFRVIPTYIYAYQDKFKSLPGDDPAGQTHLPGGAASDNGNGNGVINGAWNSTTATDESNMFWRHVRLANLAAGPTVQTDAEYIPKNAVFEDYTNVVVDKMNASKAFGGCTIEPIYYAFNSADPSHYVDFTQQECVHFTQDNKVFAIIAGAQETSSLADCAQRAPASRSSRRALAPARCGAMPTSRSTRASSTSRPPCRWIAPPT